MPVVFGRCRGTHRRRDHVTVVVQHFHLHMMPMVHVPLLPDIRHFHMHRRRPTATVDIVTMANRWPPIVPEVWRGRFIDPWFVAGRRVRFHTDNAGLFSGRGAATGKLLPLRLWLLRLNHVDTTDNIVWRLSILLPTLARLDDARQAVLRIIRAGALVARDA